MCSLDIFLIHQDYLLYFYSKSASNSVQSSVLPKHQQEGQAFPCALGDCWLPSRAGKTTTEAGCGRGACNRGWKGKNRTRKNGGRELWELGGGTLDPIICICPVPFLSSDLCQ